MKNIFKLESNWNRYNTANSATITVFLRLKLKINIVLAYNIYDQALYECCSFEYLNKKNS